MGQSANPFGVQRSIRGPWRRYLDRLEDLRPALHVYCRQLTGNVWDGEDLVQDTLVRVFVLLGKTDTSLENPRAYLVRTATNLWIDRVRRTARERAAMTLEQAEPVSTSPAEVVDSHSAVKALFQMLHPQERAAFLLKEVFDLSLEEIASMLHTSIGAVKSALSRARGRLDQRKPLAGFDPPPRAVVERFARALSERDMDVLQSLCAEDVTGELVGGLERHTFEEVRSFFKHAHMVMPRLGFGTHPWWKVDTFEGESVVLGFRTLDRVEGLNEVHRLEVLDGRIVRVRIYCFCPETLAVVAEALGVQALPRPHRSPAVGDIFSAILGRQSWRRRKSSVRR